MSKRKLHNRLRVRLYDVICDRLLADIEYGMSRAHKHNDSPSREEIVAEIHMAVTTGLCELIDFEMDITTTARP